MIDVLASGDRLAPALLLLGPAVAPPPPDEAGALWSDTETPAPPPPPTGRPLPLEVDMLLRDCEVAGWSVATTGEAPDPLPEA